MFIVEHILSSWRKTLQQRETATDRLADVIQVIRLGRRTGILTVERGRDTTFEEGNITFVNGQVRQANVEMLRGQEALAWLNTWGECRFAFIEQAAHESPSTPAPKMPFASLPSMPDNTRLRGQTQGDGNTVGSLKGLAPTGGIPRRTKSIEEGLVLLEQKGFSRTYRRLLLLIDGRRSIAELVRLVGHSAEEVARQLDELERAGFIQQ